MFPILYESALISIQTLWVFVVIALLISSYLSIKRLKRKRVNFNLFIEHSFSFLISAFLLSRIFYFVLHPYAYFPAFDLRTVLNFLSIWDQGFSFWGALIGFVTMLTYKLFKSKEELMKWYDALIVPALIGLIIGEIGAFLGGYSYGTPTSLPWAVQYESFNVKYTVPIHPTQLYTIIGVALLLWSKYKLKKSSDFFETEGNTTAYLATGFTLLSFLLEFVRGDETIVLLGIRLPMILFLIAFLISGVILFHRYRTYKTHKK